MFSLTMFYTESLASPDKRLQIMAASAIAISSYSSDESVRSPPSRVILFGDIPTIIPSNHGCSRDIYSLPYYFISPRCIETLLSLHPLDCVGLAISPFLCTDSSEAPDSSDGPPSQDPYVATVAHWRSRTITHLLLVYLRILRQFILRVWMYHIRLILDLRLEMYPSLDWVSPWEAPRHSEAFRRWCVASLSTLYPPTTSESSLGDSSERPLHSSSHSV
ncbi:hypothetical protein Tco_0572453 [Tanacetum coccineum]